MTHVLNALQIVSKLGMLLFCNTYLQLPPCWIRSFSFIWGTQDGQMRPLLDQWVQAGLLYAVCHSLQRYTNAETLIEICSLLKTDLIGLCW